MKILYITLTLLLICNTSFAKRLDEMSSNTNPDITNDLIYSQDVSDTSENSHGTGKSLTIKNLLKATEINVNGVNVGIGTVGPISKLQVNGTVTATSFVGDGSGLTGVAASASDASYGVAWDGDTTGIASKNSLYDKIESIVVSGGGWVDDGTVIYPSTTSDSVGIGTPTPSSKLHIHGGGIKGELVNKGWERILQDQDMNPSGATFSEVNSMTVMDGVLYIGYDIDGSSGTVRSPVYSWDGTTLTFLSNIGTTGTAFNGVTFLKEYKGALYAGIQGASVGDGDVYVSTDKALTWTKSYENTTTHFAYSAEVFKGNLYVGLGYSNGSIMKFDGTTWTQVYNGSGITGLVVSLYVSKGRIFAATGNTTEKILSSDDGLNWVEEESSTAEYTEINHFMDFKGKLYANVLNGGAGNNILVRNDSTATWSVVKTLSGSQCWGMNVYNDVLYVGCSRNPNGASIFMTKNGVDYVEDIQFNTLGTSVDWEAFKMINYNGSLYVGTGSNGGFGANLWRKTDSLGQLFDMDHKIVSKFNFSTRGTNWSDQFLLELNSPISFQNNVGVGTWEPLQKLHVVGTVNATAFVGDGSGLTGISGGASGWTDGGTNVYTTTSTDSLGIGTTTPTGRVDIRGDEVRIWTGAGTNTNATSAGELYVESDLEVDGTAYIGGAVTATGAVTGSNLSGTNTGDQTTISGNAGTATALAANGTNCSAGNYPLGVDASGNAESCTAASGGSGVVNSGTADRVAIYDSAGTTIDSSSVLSDNGTNIGIGTVGPVSKLQVNGTITATAFSGAGTGLTGTASSLTAGTVTTNANLTGDVTSSGNAATIADSVTVTGWALGASTATTPSAGDNDTSLATTAYVQTEISGLSAGSGGWTDGGTNVYLTTTADNVGIGTTAAIAQLFVSNVGTQASFRVDDSLGDTTPFLIDSSGNIGIGTTTASKLITAGSTGQFTVDSNGTIVWASNTANTFTSTSSGNTPIAITANSLTSGNGFSVSSSSAGQTVPLISFTQSGASSGGALRVNQSSATSTGRAFHSTNAGTGDSFLIEDQASDPTPMVVSSDGNVGIGTTTPSVKAHIVGGIRVTGLDCSGNANGGALTADSSGVFSCTDDDSGGAGGGWTDGGASITTTTTTDTVGIGTTTVADGILQIGGDNVAIGIGGTNTTATAAGELYVKGDLEVDGTITGDGSGITGLSAGGWTDNGTTVIPTTTTDSIAIGTTTPVSGSILTVNGTIAGGGSGPMAITNANVGIGTSTAGSLLVIGSTGQAAVTSSGVATLPTPNLTGKIDINNVAVNDDDCSGEQGLLWYDSTDSAFEFCKNNSGTPERLGQPSPPASQTITAGATITADACGTFKDISSAGAVTTDTTNTFTAPSADLSGCCMNVVNTGSNNITLDNNALFYSVGAADVVLGLADSAIVCTNGTVWAQMGGSNN